MSSISEEINEIRVVNRLTNSVKICIIIILSALSARREVERMDYLIAFILSVVASVTGNYINKWLDRYMSKRLDRHDSDN